MKNIFKTNIIIPSNVKIFIKENLLFIQGKQGTSCLDKSMFNKPNLSLNKKACSSSFFRLFQKQLLGICLNFVIRLNFIGIGFRVESIENQIIKIKLGFSHFIFINVPIYINIFAPKKTILVLSCVDEQLLKEFCSKIRLLKKPDIYKGKGIFYKNQKLILKEGKKK